MYIVDCTVLLMQKIDDSDDFDRFWDEFKAGFGDVHGNYWLGNDQIHQLTKDGDYKLRLDMEAEHDTTSQLAWFWAEYATFIVDSEATNYTVLIDGYSGDAGDPLSAINGTQFSTFAWYDGYYLENCADYYYGGFWHTDDCSGCYPTGGVGYFYCNTLPSAQNLLTTSQIWLLCK